MLNAVRKQALAFATSTDIVNQRRALNQAIGRCLRHRHDYGAILLVDERFRQPRNQLHLSRWCVRLCESEATGLPLLFQAISTCSQIIEAISTCSQTITSSPSVVLSHQISGLDIGKSPHIQLGCSTRQKPSCRLPHAGRHNGMFCGPWHWSRNLGNCDALDPPPCPPTCSALRWQQHLELTLITILQYILGDLKSCPQRTRICRVKGSLTVQPDFRSVIQDLQAFFKRLTEDPPGGKPPSMPPAVLHPPPPAAAAERTNQPPQPALEPGRRKNGNKAAAKPGDSL